MTGMTPTARHPSAGMLLRRLDGELPEGLAARLERHLARCAECRQRLEVLRGQSTVVTSHLRGLRVPAGAVEAARPRVVAAMRAAESRQARVGRQWRGWAAAAAVATLLILSLGVDPVRAWLLARLGLGGGAVPESSQPVAVLPSVRVGADGSVVSFQPTGEVFLLQLQASQPTGEIVLRRGASGRATAQITGAASESVMILPNGLLVENGATSSASYRVSVPAGISEVELRVGDGEPRRVAVPGEGELRLPLR